ncbi:50S ribosomal protein L11 [Candidatus Gracilibacteria bacterium HOT-871]|nr:50S ribosomal protein L11 [Candidatus Gracilibacteria bacterium HOT-871]MBB1565021.1 50S ribosomal protein L11 [Candidatus Gracilibacteria bacterium]RKW20527.1 MAG: 50S ribosomal protein L11 [Candidatus Gracilibacteria bacterium]
MAPKKAVKGYIKLQINGGQANPAPPVGPALSQHGVPIQEFTSRFNEQTKDRMGVRLPVVITVYEDKTFEFIVKQPPMAVLVKGKLNLKSASKVPNKEKVGHLTFEQVKEIATEKMPDLNAVDLAGAMMTVRGTARAGGITTDIDGLKIDEVRAKLA